MSAEPLVIHYVMEGERRGYTFTSPPKGYDDAVVRAIWRNAMPRGQGWGAETYVGARSLKLFTLPDGRFALADSIVTDQQDERGRKGIRYTEIRVHPAHEYESTMRHQLATYDVRIRQRAQDRMTICKKTNIISKTLPRMRSTSQLVMTHKFKGVNDWQVMEAFVLTLMLDPVMPLRRWGPVIPFTTLALDYREESRVVMLPADRAGSIEIAYVPVR